MTLSALRSPIRFACLIGAFVVLLAATSAQAVTVSISDVDSANPLDALTVGDTFSIDVTLLNDDRDYIAGIGVRAFGWDDSILRVTDFTVAENVFSSTVVSIPSAPTFNIGGIPNVIHPDVNIFGDPKPALLAAQDISLIQAITLTATPGTGNLDIGVDGGLVVDGDAHARVFFEVVGGGDTTISVGTALDNQDGVVNCGPADDCRNNFLEETNIAQLRVSAGRPIAAVPEPTAALLFAAGLTVASVSARRGRR